MKNFATKRAANSTPFIAAAQPIEHVVYTSARTRRREGYQIISASGGLQEADARALDAWCPSHGALLDERLGKRAIGFFPLPSGAYAVTASTPQPDEYSGRPPRVHTHAFLVKPCTLTRFSGNPFALLRALEAGGHLDCTAAKEKQLEPLRLAGRARPLREALANHVLALLGVDRLAHLLRAALTDPPLLITGSEKMEPIFECLLSLLPVEVRSEFSFTTGLKFSPRRPFRWQVVEQDYKRRCKSGGRLIDLRQPPSQRQRDDDWAEFVVELLRQKRVDQLIAAVSVARADLTVDDLDGLAKELSHVKVPT